MFPLINVTGQTVAPLNSAADRYRCPLRVSAMTDKTIICRGDFANLKAVPVDASSNVKFKWSNTQETSVCAVMPDVTSSYTVTVTDTGGCSATSTINIEVKNRRFLPLHRVM